MTMLPKFDKHNPTNKQEKLIVEFIGLLNETTEAFMRLNFKRNENITHDMFLVLRDGCLNYAANMVGDLIKILYPGQHDELLEECGHIFIAQLIHIHIKDNYGN